MTAKDIAIIVRAIGPLIKQHVETQVSPLQQRIRDLERQLGETKANGLVFRGVWEPNTSDAYRTDGAVEDV